MEFVLFGQDAKKAGTWGYVIRDPGPGFTRLGGGPKAQASLRNSSCQPLAQQLAGHVGQVGGGEAEVFGQGLAGPEAPKVVMPSTAPSRPTYLRQ